MEQMMKGKMPAQAAPAAQQTTLYSAKGSETVNGFACTKYDGTRGGQKVSEVCAGQPAQLKFSPSDFQVFEKMKDFVAGFGSAMQNSPLGGNFSQFADKGVNGFPVQQVNFRNGQAADKTEIKSLDQSSFSDADFSLGNAKKVDMQMGLPQGRR